MKKNKQSLNNPSPGFQIKVFRDLMSMTGVGEEWLLRENSDDIMAVFIDGSLRKEGVGGGNRMEVTNPGANVTAFVTKFEALAKFLGSLDIKKNDDGVFVSGNDKYLVLTKEEADERSAKVVEDTLWAFEDWFIMKHTDLDEDEIEIVKNNGRCESNNKIIKKLINDYDAFVREAIDSDGRGHFLATYNGDEYVSDRFFIYQVI